MARTARSARRRTRRHRPTPLTPQQSLQQQLDWLLPAASIFTPLRLHGNTKWAPRWLVGLALCWAWTEAACLTDAFAQALAACPALPGTAALTTYQGFLGALLTWTAPLLPLLRGRVQACMAAVGGAHWRRDGWLPLAFDGSRSTAPRTRANEAAFCAAGYGQGQTAKYRKKKSQGLRRRRNRQQPGQAPAPQVWITLLWHMGLRLPWSWRLGPSDASERADVMALVREEQFPADTLFCGDAGFVGYPLWACLHEHGHDFLVRVGANVHLLQEHADCTVTGRGREQQVLCWPQAAVRSQQPPLRLRLVQLTVGQTPMWLLTSVLDRQRLSRKAMARFYQMRWGIEVGFRGLKQTFARAKLRSRSAGRVLVELDWALLALAVGELFALREQQAGKAVGPPAQRSLAQTLRALRTCLRQPAAAALTGRDLASQLRAARTDAYRRRAAKRARYRPPNPDKKPLGDPHLRPLDRKERQKLKEFAAQRAA
jgi:Transposase DDE domain